MKIGAVKMRYPSGDPENGPAYLQRWNGVSWSCLHHIPEFDEADQDVSCKNCGLMIMDAAMVEKAMKKHSRRKG